MLRGQTASELELEFLRKYFEAVLGTFLSPQIPTGHWCGPGSKEFQQYRDARDRLKKAWRSSLLFARNPTQQLTDEACWHIAKFLTDLYQTVPFGRGHHAIVEIPDHRFSLMAAVSKGPSPDARATLPSRAWDLLLRDVGQTIWVDFLLRRVNCVPTPSTPRQVLIGSAETLRFRFSTEQESPSEQGVQTWERRARSAIEALPPAFRSMLDQPLIRPTLQDLTRLAKGFLRGFEERSVKSIAT